MNKMQTIENIVTRNYKDPGLQLFTITHYENTPIQIYRKFHSIKLKIFR